jgi:hypothetical protein
MASSTEWSFEGILTSPLLWGIICIISIAIAVSGKLDMSAAKFLLLAAWCMAVFSFYRFSPILNQSLALRISLVMALSGVFGIFLFGLWIWMQPTVTTLENVDSRIKNWVSAFPDFFAGGRIEEEHRSDMHFAYGLIFADGLGVAVSRNKDRWGRFITLGSSVIPDSKGLAHYNNLSDDQKQRLVRDLGIEIARAKIPVNNIDPSKPIQVARDIPVDATLTDVEFYNSVREMHQWVRLIGSTVNKLVVEEEEEEEQEQEQGRPTTPPSSTPYTEASPP